MFNASTKIGEIIDYNPALGRVVRRFEDSEHLRAENLRRISKKTGLPPGFLVDVLNIFDQPNTFDAEQLRQYSAQTLVAYLKFTHRYYLNDRRWELERSTQELARSYGESHPILLGLKGFFTYYMNKLQAHIELEEAGLFPYVCYLEKVHEDPPPPANSIYAHYGLDDFAHDHEDDELGAELRKIRQLVEKQNSAAIHTYPFRVVFAQFDSFELDLSIHERIEEEVLMVKAWEWEARSKR